MSKNTYLCHYPMSYVEFLSKGLKLQLGHIVYVSSLRDTYEENLVFTDRDRDVRPYIIFRIEDECLYAYPLSLLLRP